MQYIGIDPGKSGGIVKLDQDGSLVSWFKMPETEQGILAILRDSLPRRAMLEFVRASPQMGVTSSFTFGCGYGGLRMALVASGIPFDQVTPQKWQQVMQCRTKGDKSVSKRRAQELFPDVKVTNAIADALLLAEYCRRVNRLTEAK